VTVGGNLDGLLRLSGPLDAAAFAERKPPLTDKPLDCRDHLGVPFGREIELPRDGPTFDRTILGPADVIEDALGQIAVFVHGSGFQFSVFSFQSEEAVSSQPSALSVSQNSDARQARQPNANGFQFTVHQAFSEAES
jgi:hypothetical protein